MEPTEGHTVKRYDAELTHLRGTVLEMGGLVIDQIQRAVKALKKEDLDGAADELSLVWSVPISLQRKAQCMRKSDCSSVREMSASRWVSGIEQRIL